MAQPTYDELLAQLEAFKVAATKAAKGGRLTCKVGEKGGVMISGIGRFPVTLYPEQWCKVHSFTTGLPMAQLLDTPLMKFISDNRDNGLSFKTGIPEMAIPAGYGKQSAEA